MSIKEKDSAAEQPVVLTDELERIAQSWDGCEYDAPGEMIDIGASLRRAFSAVAAHLARQSPAPEKAKSVGVAGKMPGTEGFTMACFKASDVPLGTKLYAAPVAQEVEPGSAPAAADEVRNQALEEAARAIQSMGDLNPPISFGIRCAEAIRALKTTASAATSEQNGDAA